MAVLTVSRLFGSGGDDVVDQVCHTLGYRHFNKRNIARAAFEAGFSEAEIAAYSDFSEVNYKYKTFLHRLFKHTTAASRENQPRETIAATLRAEEKLFNESSALALVQQAIRDAWKASNIVIVGRGGQIILKDYPGVLHVRIEAPREDRIRRAEAYLRAERGEYATYFNIHQDAINLVAERDAASADYIRLYYGADWANPALYHAVLNTGKIGIAKTAQVIVEMLDCLFPDLALAAHPSEGAD